MAIWDKIRAVLSRGVAASAIALAVFATAFVCAWREYGNFRNYRVGEDMTRIDLTHLDEDVEHHRAVTGRLPESLMQLELVKVRDTRIDDAGQPLDAWRNPYHYRVEGDGYSLCSYGRDGLPGGAGLDADIYPRAGSQPIQPPTLWQFAFEMPTEGIMASCLLAGILAGLVWFLTLQKPAEVGKTWPRFLAAVGAMTITFLVCSFIALCIGALHLPSGH